MYQGNHGRTRPPMKRRRLGMGMRKGLLLLAAVLTLMLALVGGTLAYLVTKTQPITNTFQTTAAGIEINETFDKESKTNVTVTNNSDFDVYVRATYVAYWQSDDGTNTVLAEVPTLSTENIDDTNWTTRQPDGYYYYKHILAPYDTTTNFINEITATAKEGYHLVVDVIAEVIQAEPIEAIQEVWGVTPTTQSNSEEGQG